MIWQAPGLVALIIFGNFLTPMSFAGTVRTAYTDTQKMAPVFLKLGQSTVLRFNEKPKKVVVGNQNYFSIEFIDNDITIQPSGLVTTNLFVYCEHHIYGFILKVGDGNYDDLVQVKWRGAFLPIVAKKNPTEPPRVKVTYPNLVVRVGKKLAVKVLKIQGPTLYGLHTVDLAFGNAGSQEIATKDIRVLFHGRDQNYPAESAFDKDKFGSKAQVRGRFVMKIDRSQNLIMDIQYDNAKAKAKIQKRLL